MRQPQQVPQFVDGGQEQLICGQGDPWIKSDPALIFRQSGELGAGDFAWPEKVGIAVDG
jgi:hypothetical protein